MGLRLFHLFIWRHRSLQLSNLHRLAFSVPAKWLIMTSLSRAEDHSPITNPPNRDRANQDQPDEKAAGCPPFIEARRNNQY